MSARRPRVLIVQERMPHYRVPFFEQLRARLAAQGVDLSVAHGRGHGTMAARGDEAELPWASVIDNRVLSARGHSLVWQPVLRRSAYADLVVVEQASRMAVNYALLARQAAGGPRVAFWGHGANLQSDESFVRRWSESAKAHYSRLPHWWFAYTEGSARRVEALGFPADRITVVQNAVDTSLIEAVEVERDPDRAIFVGGLYREKRLDLLFAASDLVSAARPSFRLAVVGDGELRAYVAAAAAGRPYVDFVGARYGKELALELKASALMVIPGAVGLGVLDAFAAGLPVVTAAGRGHGPEFEYLEDGVNGFVTTPTPADLASKIASALEPHRAKRLRAGCAHVARRVTIDEMTERFASGVHSSLGTRVLQHV